MKILFLFMLTLWLAHEFIAFIYNQVVDCMTWNQYEVDPSGNRLLRPNAESELVAPKTFIKENYYEAKKHLFWGYYHPHTFKLKNFLSGFGEALIRNTCLTRKPAQAVVMYVIVDLLA